MKKKSFVIVNTRPKNQSEKLTGLLESIGVTVFELPVIEFEAVAFLPEENPVDIFIFLSANAVTYFFSQFKKKLNNARVIAVGSATKNALKNHGLFDVLCPVEFSSEGLLNLPELASVHNKKIVIISGENSKPLLLETLQQRGASVRRIVCYRRKPILYDITALFPLLAAATITHVVSTSGESLKALLTLLEAHRDWLITKTLCVISDTMRDAAIKVGFTDIIQAENATDEAIIKAIKDRI